MGHFYLHKNLSKGSLIKNGGLFYRDRHDRDEEPSLGSDLVSDREAGALCRLNLS